MLGIKKVLAMILLSTGMLIAGGDTGAIAQEPMPVLTGLQSMGKSIFSVCSKAPQAMIYAEHFLRNGLFAATRFTLTPDRAELPFATYVSGTATVYVDFNRDGLVDRTGKVGDPAVGATPCDIVHLVE